ncbi:hypothetical protein ACGFU4_35725, partial [Streptomyces sp. NPDC048511]|uniref:hypothetical protein n=1 Tax=Streptomyces sp. NPDC048511 TaxID=3365562 RepID=UPI00371BC7CC
ILQFAQRTARTGRGRRTPQPPPSEEPAAVDTPQQRLAETAEAWLRARGKTLTDPDAADTYRATLDLVQLMHDGSLATGSIGQDEHQHLTGMIEGLRAAPDAL